MQGVGLEIEQRQPDPHGRQDLHQRQPPVGEQELQPLEQHGEGADQQRQRGEISAPLAQPDDEPLDCGVVTGANGANQAAELRRDDVSPAGSSLRRLGNGGLRSGGVRSRGVGSAPSVPFMTTPRLPLIRAALSRVGATPSSSLDPMTAAPDAAPPASSADEPLEVFGVDAATLREAVKVEWRRTFRPPYEVPIVVAVNACLLLACWALLPHSAITRLHGNFALPLSLSSWMYADVPATNTLAPDRRRARTALDEPAKLRRLLLAKNATLWLIATPAALIATAAVAIQTGQWIQAAIVAFAVAIVPLGLLGISSWVGIIFPYHPRPLRWRWEHRRPWRRTARWITLVVTPYVLVPAIAAVLAAPSFILWQFVAKHGLGQRLTDFEFALGALVAIAVAVATWYAGTAEALRLIRRRHDQLAAYLDDPERG